MPTFAEHWEKFAERRRLRGTDKIAISVRELEKLCEQFFQAGEKNEANRRNAVDRIFKSIF